MKGSLFPRVIIPEQRNRNVLKTPRWTFLTGAGAFGCTVAPLFPSMRLEQPDHLLHPPLPQNNQAVIKKQVFSLQYWAKCPQASPLPRADRATLRQQGQGQQVSRCLWHWEHPQHPGPSQSHGDIHGDSCPSLPMPNPTGGKGQGGRQAEKEGEEKQRGERGKKKRKKDKLRIQQDSPALPRSQTAVLRQSPLPPRNSHPQRGPVGQPVTSRDAP